MSGGYVICEYEKVKENFPYYSNLMTNLRNTMIAKAQSKWGMRWA